MPHSQTDKGKIVLEYVKKFSEVPAHTLSRKIHDEYPNLFPSPEKARDLVRYYRGKVGVKNRLTNPHFDEINGLVPESDPFNYTPFILSDSDYPIALGCDAHMPYHDKRAMEVFFEECYSQSVKTIIFNGDWMDCYQLSYFERDPTYRNMKDEISMIKILMMKLRKELPDVRFIYKFGNHEERWDRYVIQNSPDIYHIESTHLDSILRMDDLSDKTIEGFDKSKVEIVKDKRYIKIGHLYILHGHEFGSRNYNPVSPARSLYLKTKKSAIEGHYHFVSEHTEPLIGGDTIGCWSAGCLCHLTPRYMPLNKWSQGFAIIDKRDEFFVVKNQKIINGIVV